MEILSFWNFGWLFLLYFCKESWTRIMNASSVWNILWWILVAQHSLTKLKTERFSWVTHFFHTSLHLLAQQHVHWANLGILPLKDPPPPSHTTRQPITLLRLCFKNCPAGLANENTRCPHLLGTATICLTPWFEAVRSDPGPETTIHHHDASVLCKLPWRHRAEGTPEVSAKSERISNTHTLTHMSTHWHN